MAPLIKVTLDGKAVEEGARSEDLLPGRQVIQDEEREENMFLAEVKNWMGSLTNASIAVDNQQSQQPTPATSQIFEFWQQPGSQGIADKLKRFGLELFSNFVSPGKYDGLLAEGKSLVLLQQLASIYANEPDHPQAPGDGCAIPEYWQNCFSPNAAAKLLETGAKLWNPNPEFNIENLHVASGQKLIIVGDTHGQLRDVLWMFFKYGPPSPTNRYLFNGDMVDRGGHSLEVLLLLISLKRDRPDSLFILRGNHEDPMCNTRFGFITELQLKFGAKDAEIVFNVCKDLLFPMLPLLAIVNGRTQEQHRFCVMHGGIPVGKTNFEVASLYNIQRTRLVTLQGARDKESVIIFQLLWNDPYERKVHHQEAGGHRGNKFQKQDTTVFLEKNSFHFMVRSHEVPRTLRGFESRHGGKCFTIFSASNYCGRANNFGGVLICSEKSGQLHAEISEHWAPSWSDLQEFITPESLSPEQAEDRYARASRHEEQYGKGHAFRTDVETNVPLDVKVACSSFCWGVCRCRRRKPLDKGSSNAHPNAGSTSV